MWKCIKCFVISKNQTQCNLINLDRYYIIYFFQVHFSCWILSLVCLAGKLFKIYIIYSFDSLLIVIIISYLTISWTASMLLDWKPFIVQILESSVMKERVWNEEKHSENSGCAKIFRVPLKDTFSGYQKQVSEVLRPLLNYIHKA